MQFAAFAITTALTVLPLRANGQTLDEQVAALAGKLSSTLAAKGVKKVAVADFVDLQGRTIELGRFVAEQLSVELVNSPDLSVIDRSNLNRILAEHKLTADGLLDPENAQIVRRFSGVEAILVGTVTGIDDDIAVTVKAISTETAEIVAAGKMNLAKTRETQQFLSHGVTGDASTAGARPREAIATQDFGDLRVALMRVQPFSNKTPGLYGRAGFNVVLELTNLNINNDLILAGNAEYDAGSSGRSLLRAKVMDSAGNSTTDAEARGLPVVRARGSAPPTSIADVIMNGEKGEDGRRYPSSEKIWVGDLATLKPGEATTITVVVWRKENSKSPAWNTNDLHFECEIVAGPEVRGKKTMRLSNVVFTGLRGI